jgi:DNA-binding NarL/FixJ family response regulator
LRQFGAASEAAEPTLALTTIVPGVCYAEERPAMELLERATDLERLDLHLRQAAAGHGGVVFVAGEAGVGKTALVDAFCAGAATATTILRTSCDALSTPAPLGPLRDLGPALGLHPERFPLDRDARDSVFRSVLNALTADEGPTVVVAEDAQWADGATIELLRFLARRIGERGLLTVVTYRDDEIGPDHPLRLLLGDLATARTIHRIGLRPLSAAAVGALARDSDRDPAELHRLTGGNPFFLTEILATDDDAVPATVGDAVLARAARLSPEARAVLDVAAVIGTAIDLDLLLTVAGPVPDETDECIARGLLGVAGEVLVFRHELTREAILAALSPTRRRLLHVRVLSALREAGGEPDLALLAHHAEAAGDREAVLAFATAAAEQAAALSAHREAAAQYARALRFADRLPAAERARLYEGRSVACYMIDQGDEAVAARQAALDLWRSLGDHIKEGENLRWLAHAHWLQGRGAETEAAAIAALQVLEPLASGPELAMVYSTLAQVRMFDNDLEGTLLWGHRAIALAEQLGETETLIHALASIGAGRQFAGDDRGQEDLERSLQLALDHGYLEHACRGLLVRAWTALSAMRLDEADRRIAAAVAFATEHDLDFRRGYLLAGRAALRFRQGAWGEAEEELRPLLSQPMLSPVTRMVALTTWGQLCARRGRPQAAGTLDEALALAERTGHLSRLGPVRAARADAALLAGDPARARVEALAASDLVFARGNRWQRGEIAWLLWQSGERDIPTGDLAEPYALQIAGDFAAAAEAWRKLGCPYEAACALAASDDPELVRRAIPALEQLGAEPAMGRALRRLQAHGGQSLPVLRRGPRSATRAHPHELTEREQEVLRLLVAGHSNREIGEVLFVSPTTAARHVANIYAKLGVDSRARAISFALERGLA